MKRVREIAGADRRVRAQAQDVVLIHPGVVRGLGGAVPARERRPGKRIEGPPLGAQVPLGGARPVETTRALATVEAGDVAARQRHPRHAKAVDVEATHAVSGRRDPVDFHERGLRRIRPELESQDVPRVADVRAPDGAIGRAVRDAVEPEPDPFVLRGIVRLIGLDVRVALAVAVGVDHQRRPALRFPRVTGRPEHLRVDPADDGELVLEVVAEPQRVVGVLGEVQVVRAEARVDERELFGLRVVDRDLTGVLHEPVRGARERVRLRRRMARRRRAVGRRALGRAHLRGEVDASVPVHHRIVRVHLRVPDLLRPEVRRRRDHRVGERRAGRVTIAHRHAHRGLRHLHRIQNRHVVRAELRGAVDQAECVDRGLASIGHGQIVDVVLRREPVVHGDDEVALHAVRSRRRRHRQLAGADAIRPLRQAAQVSAVVGVEGPDGPDHRAAARPRLEPPRPRIDRRALRHVQRRRDLARRLVAELMTVPAAVQLNHVEPLLLAFECHGNAVAIGTRAREQALVGNLEHGEPVDGRIVFGRGRRARRHHRVEIQ